MKTYRVTVEIDVKTDSLESAIAISKESLTIPYKVNDIEVKPDSIDFNITRVDLINKGE